MSQSMDSIRRALLPYQGLAVHPHHAPVGGWWPWVGVANASDYFLYEVESVGDMVAAQLARRNLRANAEPICCPSLPDHLYLPHLAQMLGYTGDSHGVGGDYVPLRVGGVEHEAVDEGEGAWRVRVGFWIRCGLEVAWLKGSGDNLDALLPSRAVVFIGSGYAHLPRAWLVGTPESPLRLSIEPRTQPGGPHTYWVEYRGVDRRPWRLAGGQPMRPLSGAPGDGGRRSRYLFFPLRGRTAWEHSMWMRRRARDGDTGL